MMTFGLDSDPTSAPPSPNWLDIAFRLATVTIALVLLLGVFATTIHFTIQADVGPRLNAIETSVNNNRAESKIQFSALEQRLENLEQRLDRIEVLLSDNR